MRQIGQAHAFDHVVGVTMLFACTSAFLSLVFGSTEYAGKTFHAGGYTDPAAVERILATGRSTQRQRSSYSHRSGSSASEPGRREAQRT